MTNAEKEASSDMEPALFRILTLAYSTWLITNVAFMNRRISQKASTSRCYNHDLSRCVNMPNMFPVSCNEDHMVSIVATQLYRRGSIGRCSKSRLQNVLFCVVFSTLFAFPVFQHSV